MLSVEKAREARLRRLADKLGFRLRKSRRAVDAGNYALLDVDTGFAAIGLGPLGYDADLDEVEEWLTSD